MPFYRPKELFNLLLDKVNHLQVQFGTVITKSKTLFKKYLLRGKPRRATFCTHLTIAFAFFLNT